MDHSIEKLDAKGLRNFGLSFGAIVAVLFGLLFPWLLDLAYPRWPWPLWVGITVWSLVAPLTLRPFYRLWMRLGIVLSKITTPVILGMVYFLVITPTGLMAGLFRRDPMRRDCGEHCESF
jgi:hypothetical protein